MYTGELAAISNKADWRGTIEVSDPETGAMISLAGAEIKLALREQKSCGNVLTATESDGHITLGGTGIFTFAFLVGEAASLMPGPHEVGLTLKLASGVTYQLLICTINVLDGVVR